MLSHQLTIALFPYTTLFRSKTFGPAVKGLSTRGLTTLRVSPVLVIQKTGKIKIAGKGGGFAPVLANYNQNKGQNGGFCRIFLRIPICQKLMIFMSPLILIMKSCKTGPKHHTFLRLARGQ